MVDFELSRIMAAVDSTLWATQAIQAPGTLRWQAPELLAGSQPTVSAEGDIYAFGMTLLVSSFLLNFTSPTTGCVLR